MGPRGEDRGAEPGGVSVGGGGNVGGWAVHVVGLGAVAGSGYCRSLTADSCPMSSAVVAPMSSLHV